MNNNVPSKEYIDKICILYGTPYDDRIEDSRPPAAGNSNKVPGEDWTPGKKAKHKSLIAFQKELREEGINISTSKIKKILISGGCWSTDTSRRIGQLFDNYTSVNNENKEAMTSEDAIKRIASELDVSIVTVNVNLPYMNSVYNLDDKSSNALRCEKYKKQNKGITKPNDIKDELKELQNAINRSNILKEISVISEDEHMKRYKEWAEIINRMRVVIPGALKNISIMSEKLNSAFSKYQVNNISLDGLFDGASELARNMKTISGTVDSFISSEFFGNLQELLSGLPSDVKETKFYGMAEELYSKKDIRYEDITWVVDFYSADGLILDDFSWDDEKSEDGKLLKYIREIIDSKGIGNREKLVLLMAHIEPLVYNTLSMQKKTEGPLKSKIHDGIVKNMDSGMKASGFAIVFIAAIVYIVFARTETFSFIDSRIPFRNNILHNGVIGYSDEDVDVAYDLLVKYVCILGHARKVLSKTEI